MAKRTIAPELRSPQGKSFRTRHLKVRKSFYDYQFNRSNNFEPYIRPAPVPWLQIKGYWLNKAGFSIGTAVEVTVQEGCLVLRTISGSS